MPLSIFCCCCCCCYATAASSIFYRPKKKFITEEKLGNASFPLFNLAITNGLPLVLIFEEKKNQTLIREANELCGINDSKIANIISIRSDCN